MVQYTRFRAPAFVLAAILSVGCSSVDRPAAPAAPTGAPAQTVPGAGRPASATLRVTIPTPAPAPLGSARSPRYLSPATKAIAIAFTSTTKTSPTTLTFNQNLTAGSAGCTGGLTVRLVCNVVFALLPDTYTATVTTYDQVLNGTTPQGNALSANQSFPVTIAPNVANAVNVILGGIPTGTLFIPASTSTLSGGPTAFSMLTTAGAQKVTVDAVDADDNIILGPGAPSILLSSSDPTFTATVIDATLNPNEFLLTPAAGPIAGATVTITAAVTPATGGGGPITASYPITLNGPSGVSTLAGSVAGTSGYQNGIGASTLFSGPRSIARTQAGSLIVADNVAYRALTTGGTVTTLAASVSGNGATFVSSAFMNPSGVAVDAAGNIYASQVDSGVIYKLAVNGTISAFATVGSNINAIAIDSSGTIYAPDTGSGGLYRITSAGSVTQIASDYTFAAPVGVAVDSANGYVYVGDTLNHRIAKLPTVGGTVTTVVGGGSLTTAVDGPTGTSACGSVDGMTIANGTLYFTDYTNNVVRKYAISGASAGITTTIAGSGAAGNVDSAVPLTATFNAPFGIAVIPGDALYVSDLQGYTIRAIRGVL